MIRYCARHQATPERAMMSFANSVSSASSGNHYWYDPDRCGFLLVVRPDAAVDDRRGSWDATWRRLPLAAFRQFGALSMSLDEERSGCRTARRGTAGPNTL